MRVQKHPVTEEQQVSTSEGADVAGRSTGRPGAPKRQPPACVLSNEVRSEPPGTRRAARFCLSAAATRSVLLTVRGLPALQDVLTGSPGPVARLGRGWRLSPSHGTGARGFVTQQADGQTGDQSEDKAACGQDDAGGQHQ